LFIHTEKPSKQFRHSIRLLPPADGRGGRGLHHAEIEIRTFRNSLESSKRNRKFDFRIVRTGQKLQLRKFHRQKPIRLKTLLLEIIKFYLQQRFSSSYSSKSLGLAGCLNFCLVSKMQPVKIVFVISPRS